MFSRSFSRYHGHLQGDIISSSSSSSGGSSGGGSSSSSLSVRIEQLNSIGRIFMKYDI